MGSLKHAFQNWLRLKCKLFNSHEFVIEKKYTDDILKLHCKKCQKNYGVHLKSALIFDWDEDMILWLSILEKNLEQDVRLVASLSSDSPFKIVI